MTRIVLASSGLRRCLSPPYGLSGYRRVGTAPGQTEIVGRAERTAKPAMTRIVLANGGLRRCLSPPYGLSGYRRVGTAPDQTAIMKVHAP